MPCRSRQEDSEVHQVRGKKRPCELQSGEDGGSPFPQGEDIFRRYAMNC